MAMKGAVGRLVRHRNKRSKSHYVAEASAGSRRTPRICREDPCMQAPPHSTGSSRFRPAHTPELDHAARAVRSGNSSFVNISSNLAAFAHHGSLTIRKLPHVSIVGEQNAIRSRLEVGSCG
ncbi:hypothetical protein RHIZ404_220685 [Rhizobium sp. EC-SD404]|nr:hypothetical protein RHIZ404_220685 [Rhizobium sp. EC-SD404]